MKLFTFTKITTVCLFFSFFLVKPVLANRANNEESDQTGSLVGDITDVNSGQKIGWVTLLIEELNRAVASHTDGSYHLFDLPEGAYTLKTYRVGYQDGVFKVNIISGDTTRFNIKLRNAPLFTENIVVEANKTDPKSLIQRAEVSISGTKLRQNLGKTIAETITMEPGLAQRTMGPAPARPVLRGLGGDRLLLLEDGKRTGDMSATSTDHSVVIEPITAERIEVIRGPEAIVYGSNTLGGVIDVHRGSIPTNLPHKVTGSASAQGETVNTGYAGGLNLVAPLGQFAARIDGSYRRGLNVKTPEGDLENTAIKTLNGSVGLGYYFDWGYLGASGSYYKSEYGIPPDPYGGHINGVDIELNRKHFESRAEFFPDSKWLRRIILSQVYNRYYHGEYEHNGNLGIEYGVNTQNYDGTMFFKDMGIFQNGKFGIWGEYRDYAAGGFSFTPPSKEYSTAAFIYEEAIFGDFYFNGSLRYDYKKVSPEKEKESTTVGLIRERSFYNFSGGVSTMYFINKHWSLRANLMRSFRAPGIEELFSEGPHLAAYSYEVGNADLGTETGFGLDISSIFEHDNGHIHLALFRNQISGYIFPENTGERSLKRADLFVYQYVGKNVLMTGLEAALHWRYLDSWFFDLTGSYVRGELTEDQSPLPYIPPLNTKVHIHYEYHGLSIGAGFRAAAEQNNLGQFENAVPLYDSDGTPIKDKNGNQIYEFPPTDGYLVFDFEAQYYFSTGVFLHTLALSVNNIFDTVYREHLNRVKHVMPEPGRNIKLLYKIYF